MKREANGREEKKSLGSFSEVLFLVNIVGLRLRVTVLLLFVIQFDGHNVIYCPNIKFLKNKKKIECAT